MTRFPDRKAATLIAGATLLSFAAAIAAAPAGAQSLSQQITERIAKARAAERDRNFGVALHVYESAMSVEGATTEETHALLKNRADMFEKIELFDRAETDLSTVLKVKPNDASVYADRGYFYMRRSRFGDALDDFISGARIEPGNPTYLFGAGRALSGAENHEGALRFYAEALKQTPNDSRYHLAYAEALVRLQRWTEARDSYERAIALGLNGNAPQFFAYAGRGYVALMRGEFMAAIRDFDQALTLRPDAANVIMWRGYAQERRGNFDAALQDYREADKRAPNDLAVRASLLRIHGVMK